VFDTVNFDAIATSSRSDGTGRDVAGICVAVMNEFDIDWSCCAAIGDELLGCLAVCFPVPAVHCRRHCCCLDIYTPSDFVSMTGVSGHPRWRCLSERLFGCHRLPFFG